MGCCSCFLIWTALILGAVMAAFKIYVKLTVGRCKSKRNIAGHVVIVTGANVGIGLETAKDLAMRGAKVILACRSLEKGAAAVEEIKQETGNTNVHCRQLDLSSMASVRRFSAEIVKEETRLDVLVNNAGAATTDKVMTAEGLETNMAANHFGPFLLTNLLLDLLRKTPKSRIVNVSSSMHMFAGKELDLDNLNSEKKWEPISVYARTKLANVLFTRELHRRLKVAGLDNVTVNALHPGAVKTAFLRHAEEIWYMLIVSRFNQLFFKTVQEGAETSVYVAVAQELEGLSGGYYADCRPRKISKLAQDQDLGKKLWEVSAKFVQLKPEETIVDKKNN